ncbi:hypothetical protein NK356_10630 [Chryseobacterium sp. S0630]|uniref:hypothetical protein n=1 Tax=unclassified Chryseobacterium TaxID=2593645 RepID=UPI00054D1240|nr:hypothetical protein [Chryseobacterium sp. S0630]MCP1299623.1 hypothetical protein [Chryseobacterium sp. S0630]
MRKIMFLMAIAAISFVSCNKKNIESSSFTDNNDSMYKISELPLIPEFAKPIEKEGEVRKFTLIKNDGTKLYFELKSTKEKFSGDKHKLAGFVTNHMKIKGKASMTVGENSYDLSYTDNQEDCTLQGENKRSIKYKNIEINLPGIIKENF